MNDYIIVTTLCNKRDVADKIINNLLEKNLVAGSHLYEVESKYWWDNKIETEKEYKIDFRTKREHFSEKVHDYYVAEISAVNIETASKDFLDWIDETVK